MTLRSTIDEFLAHERIAFVGVSRDPRHFSRMVFREMAGRGYGLIPVNPEADEIDGHRAYRRIADLPEGIDAALIMTPPDAAYDAVHECADAGMRYIWLHRGLGGPEVDVAARALCHDRRLQLVDGECPLMFLDHAGWIHRVHAFGKRCRGSYPPADVAV